MHIHNLYADENGESHFRDVEVDWAEDQGHSQLSERIPATGIIFRRTSGDYNLDWHRAPRRQYIVNLDAAVQVRVSDGEVRIIKAGEISRGRHLWQRPSLCRGGWGRTTFAIYSD